MTSDVYCDILNYLSYVSSLSHFCKCAVLWMSEVFYGINFFLRLDLLSMIQKRPVYIRANWLKTNRGQTRDAFADKLMVGNWRTTLPTHESDTKLFIGLGLYQLCCPVGRFTDWLRHGFVFFRRFLIINIFIKLSKGGN